MLLETHESGTLVHLQKHLSMTRLQRSMKYKWLSVKNTNVHENGSSNNFIVREKSHGTSVLQFVAQEQTNKMTMEQISSLIQIKHLKHEIYVSHLPIVILRTENTSKIIIWQKLKSRSGAVRYSSSFNRVRKNKVQ
jgi:hypothetical protein